MMGRTTQVEIKAITDTHVTVAGYGVVYGGRDLYGETFDGETDFMLSLVPEKPVLYDHALGQVKHFIGKVKTIEETIEGLWVEAELERNRAYVEQVRELIEQGALGWSSGSVGHMVVRSGSNIRRWPVIEFSLTPTPAEPRTLGVELIKSLSESNPQFEALLPEDAAATASAGADGGGDSSTEPAVMEEQTMNEQPAEAVAEAMTPEMKAAIDAAVKAQLAAQQAAQPANNTQEVNMPGVNLKTKRGDSEIKAYAHWIRTGDDGAIKASNATPMAEGTGAAGGYAVPTGMYNNIVARRDELSLPAKLGVRKIPGKGLTVNVPLDGDADADFILKAEAAAYDADAPALGQKALTLAKYTKQIKISEELLADEDANLTAFLEDFVARGVAMTYNNLLLTEVRANGTNLKTLAGAAAIAIGEPEDVVSNSDLAYYLDDSPSVAWVMLPTTYWYIQKLSSANMRYYGESGVGDVKGKQLLGYPVHFSNKASPLTTGQKSLVFGNFNYVGMREGPAIELLRDPYSNAANGQINLWYRFRAVFGVLQAEAIGYATQA